MSYPIAQYLIEDGLANGLIYMLLAVALVLVFSVTRVILIPQGDFVSLGGLTLAALQDGRTPGSIWLLLALATVAAVLEVATEWRKASVSKLAKRTTLMILPPIAISGIALTPAAHNFGPIGDLVLCAAIVIPMGPYIYRIAFQPVVDASILLLLMVSVGVHLALTAAILAIFGAEGFRTSPILEGSYQIGNHSISGQAAVMFGTAILLLLLLSIFFGKTLTGKALKAASINRRGARIVGIKPEWAGNIAFTAAALIGFVSAVLIGPTTTLFYDSGLILGLKGFVAAIIGGMGGYLGPVIAALGVGIGESFASFWASPFKEILVFLSILPVLLWRSLTIGSHHDDEH